MSIISEQKAALRRSMRARLAELTSDDLVAGKMGVFGQIQASQILNSHDVMLAFHPHRNEIDCRYVLRVWLADEKDLFLPRVAPDGITLEPWKIPNILAVVEGYRGYMEPDPAQSAPGDLSSVDIVLLPGLAFDAQGGRLGQGKGHYDRLLARLRSDVTKIGMAYDWQVLRESLPHEDHDRAVGYVCTPTRLIRCGEKQP